MKRLFTAPMMVIFQTLLIALTSCGTEPASWQVPENLPVVVEPLLTRVSGTSFEAADKIGLQIRNSEGVYSANQLLTYSGSYFMADSFIWYNNINLQASLTAYYPYVAGDALPTTHTVASDQSSAAAVEASDLLAATRSGVTPTADPVQMVFSHLMSKIQITLTNNSDGEVTGVRLGGSRTQANLELENKLATVNNSVAAQDITPYTLTAGSSYEAIVVPQQVAFIVTVSTNDGKVHSHQMVSTTLAAGKLYTLNLTLTNIDLSATLSADIEEWSSGGAIAEEGSGSVSNDPLTGDDQQESPANTPNELSYEGVTYSIATLADDRIWMVENLRYNPSVEGVYEPGESLSAEEYGLLYTAVAALGVESITAENKDSLEGSQGICPTGWHIPTETEVTALFAAYDNIYPEELRFTTPYFWNSDQSKYVELSERGCFLTSTPYEVSPSSYIKVATINPTTGGISFENRKNPYAYPVRCIKNE